MIHLVITALLLDSTGKIEFIKIHFQLIYIALTVSVEYCVWWAKSTKYIMYKLPVSFTTLQWHHITKYDPTNYKFWE